MRKTFDKPVAPFPAARAFCLKTMLDQHSLSTNASRIVHRHELGSSDDVQDEFQPASNSKNMKDVLQWPPQCSGSGAEYRSGATCFWGSMIRIHKSEVWIRIRLWMGMVL
jgi:hypothetical protein